MNDRQTPPLSVALIGYGLAGRAFHAPLVRATGGLELACVVSSDTAKVHADLPDVAVRPDLAAVLGDPAIDLVVIATPDALHREHALAALDAGKHVVVDKPFAPDLGSARAIADRAQGSGQVLSVFHNRRWDADFLTLRQVIEAGDLGEVVQFESHFDRYRLHVRETWKDHRAGGVWQDLGPHLVDQALCLFGLPEAVSADLAVFRDGASGPDYAHVVLRYAARRVILHMSMLAPDNGLRFAVHGTHGSFIKHGLDVQEPQALAGKSPRDADWGLDPIAGTLTRVDNQGGLSVSTVANRRGAYPDYYARLRDAILGDGPNPVTAGQALDVMRVIEAGLTSAREGRAVSLP